MINASMPTKCIDHIPPPIVSAAAASHTRRANPRAGPTCALRSRAVYRDAGDQNRQSDEIRIVCSGNDHRDRSNSDQRLTGDESAVSPGNAADNVIGASLKADVGRPSPDDWFAKIKMLLWRSVHKMER